ncbi:MAG TPA: phosphatidylglycerol lysyltransferase domain-containing protein [Vicinamibacteria bacterium]|nr:phosphatidylglycerol lysyltransferase domain-containing protein [Vicinamibacteria bacterium]
MEALLARYGYLILFPGIVVEGEAFLLAGAFMAHRGVFDLPVVIAVAVAATMCGDQVYYRAARSRGRSWLERRQGARAKYSKWIDLTARKGVWLLLASRWTFGLRIVIPAACGAVGMRPAVFTAVDFVAVLIWALALGLAGYYSGAAVERHLKDIQHVGIWVLVAVILSVAAIVGSRRVVRQARVRELNLSDLHALVPFVIGLIGVFNIVMALSPRRAAAMANLAQWVPLDVSDGNRPVMLFAGLALLQVTRNLARRKELAWWVATAALALSVVAQVRSPRFEIQHAVVAVLLVAYLLIFRRRFSAQSDPATLRWAVAMAPALGLLIVAYGYFGLHALESHFEWPPGATVAWEAIRGGILITHAHLRPLDVPAARFLASLQVAGWVARLYVLVLLLRPVILHDRLEAPAEDVERIRRMHGGRALSAFALRPDKHHLLVAEGRGLVAYAVRNAVAVACGGPLCTTEDLPASVRDFLDHCHRHGWRPCLYAVPGEELPVYASAGLKTLRIGDEGIVALPAARVSNGPIASEEPAALPRLSGAPPPKAKPMSVWAYHRTAGPDPVLDEQIVEVSDEWLAAREIGELHFTFGSLDLEELGASPVFVCGRRRHLEAFCTWLPYADGRGMALNLLRRRRGARAGSRELLLGWSLEALAASGVREVSLGLEPVGADPEGEKTDMGPFGLADRLGALYRYDDLFALKDAFAPRWESRHLVYPGDAGLPRVAVAVVDAHTTLRERSPIPRVIAALRALRRRAARRPAR